MRIFNFNYFISDSHFHKNEATQHGGGAHLTNHGSSTIVNTSWTLNTAIGHAGAVIVENKHRLTLDHNFISTNTAQSHGGAFFFVRAIVNISYTKVTGNQAQQGGGIFSQYKSELIIRQTSFAFNKATNGGRGHEIRLESNAAEDAAILAIINTHFNNTNSNTDIFL